MRQMNVSAWLVFFVLYEFVSLAHADLAFRASAHESGALYAFSMSATVTLNREETEIRISLETDLASPACASAQVCYAIYDVSIWNLGPAVSLLGSPITTIKVSPNQVTMLKTNQIWIDSTYGVPQFGTYYDRLSRVHVRFEPHQTYMLAEGATGSFFDTDILIVNPNDVLARVEMAYLPEHGGAIQQRVDLLPWSRTTIRVDAIPGLEATTMSVHVRSLDFVPLVVERTMKWDATGYEAHTEKARASPHRTWYFAEGAQGYFRTYLLLANPLGVPNSASVRFMTEAGVSYSRRVDLAASARTTIDLGTIPELQDSTFAIEVTFDREGMAERSTYVGEAPFFSVGHASAGANSAATEWILAEGATGPFFETFVLVGNPNAAPADLTVRYFTTEGSMVTRRHHVAPRARLTINIEAEDSPALRNAGVATYIVSNVPIVVERAQYWPGTAEDWYGAHAGVGVSTLHTQWGFAEGRVGGPEQYQTYFLLANPRPDDATVRIRFVPEGGTSIDREFVVPSLARVTIATGPGTTIPELDNVGFGAYIESTAPIAVERSMYWNADGVVWAAGTNATATSVDGARRLFVH